MIRPPHFSQGGSGLFRLSSSSLRIRPLMLTLPPGLEAELGNFCEDTVRAVTTPRCRCPQSALHLWGHLAVRVGHDERQEGCVTQLPEVGLQALLALAGGAMPLCHLREFGH